MQLKESIQVRLGTTQASTIRRAAEHEGVAVSAFIREAAWARALLVLASQNDAWALVLHHMARLARTPATLRALDDALREIAADDALRREQRPRPRAAAGGGGPHS